MNDFIHKIIFKILLNQENIHWVQTILLTRVYSLIVDANYCSVKEFYTHSFKIFSYLSTKLF